MPVQQEGKIASSILFYPCLGLMFAPIRGKICISKGHVGGRDAQIEQVFYQHE